MWKMTGGASSTRPYLMAPLRFDDNDRAATGPQCKIKVWRCRLTLG
jgi:hypothetical protein